MNGLDLFSGIGGLTIALSPWVEPVAYCENDRYAQSVLLCRMANGSLPVAPIWDDVCTLKGRDLPSVDMVYGGFPCQDISNAGARKGLDGERSGLFFEILRLASELRPKFVFLENVAAITVRGLERVVSEFTSLGYDCRWTILSAATVGAPHIRERWWFLAHANGSSRGKQSRERSGIASNAGPACKSWPFAWSRKGGFESGICRAANGIPMRVDRLRGLGNAVVPQCAREAFKILAGIES